MPRAFDVLSTVLLCLAASGCGGAAEPGAGTAADPASASNLILSFDGLTLDAVRLRQHLTDQRGTALN